MKRYVLIAATATMLLTAAGTASSQTIIRWLDRQIQGTARHLTPRHHKPGEAPYKKIKGDLQHMHVEEIDKGYRVTYTVDGKKIVRFYPRERVEKGA
jgi:hypothetical protein